MQTTQQGAARIIEIFSSIQGEGIHVGQRHLFIRFWNCNLGCHYCDTDYRGPYEEYTPERLTERVRRHLREDGPFHAVSLTGGEPLLWAGFLRGWLPWLREMGQAVYLETNGTLPSALEEVLPWVDIVAMDVKPPSATADRQVWAEHERFLRLARGGGPRPGVHGGGRHGDGPRRPEVFVKVVVTAQTLEEEIGRAVDLVAEVDRGIPFVLQPVTPWGPVREPPSPDQLERWACRAGRELADVRIVPQIHRLLGVP